MDISSNTTSLSQTRQAISRIERASDLLERMNAAMAIADRGIAPDVERSTRPLTSHVTQMLGRLEQFRDDEVVMDGSVLRYLRRERRRFGQELEGVYGVLAVWESVTIGEQRCFGRPH